MTTIQSFPVQQHASKSHIGTNKFPKHFKGNKRLNRIFAWCNKFRFIHMVIILLCIHLCLWLPLINVYSTEANELLPYRINGSLTRKEQLDRAYLKQCLLLPTSLVLSTPIDNIKSYNSMKILIVLLSAGSYIMVALTQVAYKSASDDLLENPYAWFCWCRKIFIYLVGWFLCHQLLTAVACRPVAILYDLRYTSMLIIQITGFFICLLFAFFLGVKFASIKPAHRQVKSSNLIANNID